MIAVSYIAKDDSEAELLEGSILSINKYVDKIFICGTNKPDGKLRELCKKYNGEYSFIKWEKDFAKARNYAFSQIPQDKYEWILWLDCDDVFLGGDKIRTIVKRSEIVGADHIYLNYIYQADLEEDGTIRNRVVEHFRERIVRNDGKSKWVGELHENFFPQVDIKRVENHECEVLHITSHKRLDDNMARNVEILLMKLDREQGKDPRTLYYLAKAYYDEGHLIKQGEEKLKSYKKAEDLIKKYLTMSGWAEERGQAIEYLVEIYRETGRFDEAIRASMTAIEMFPQYPSLYAGLAMTYLLQKQYDKAWFWVEWAEKVPMPATTLVITGRDLQLRMLEIYFQLGLETNHLDKSYMAIGKMIKMFPDSEVMQRRLKELTKIKKEGELVKYYCRIGKYLDEKKKTDNLLSLISSIPFEIMDNPYIQEMKKDLLPSREWGKKEIAIFCGAAYEEWDETSVKGGIGGSEEAVIYASRELSKLGYKVTVYNTTPKKHTDEYGVNWERYTSFNPKDKFNYLIIWRNVFIFDNEFNAKKKILWLHDIPNQLDYTEKRLKNIDKILVLSKYHRAFLPSVPDDKVYVTANGIIDEHPKMKRQNNLMVYGSSYDRGLEHLLDMWGDIKKNVPDAELHIFYGWNTFDVMFQNNPERKEWKKRMENKMRQEGIKHLGRINHAKVAQEMALADVWAYPTHFEEISCLTAMKAQTYGAIPCYIDLAALKETCQHGIRIEGDIYDNETKEIYKQRLITLLQDGKGKEIIRKQMIGSVNFEWGRVIKGWKNDILY